MNNSVNERIRRRLLRTEEDIKNIKNALLGSCYDSQGLIKRLEHLEQYKEADKKLKWMIAGGSFVAGAIIKWLAHELPRLFF